MSDKQPTHYRCHHCQCILYENETYFARIVGSRILPFCSVRCIESWKTWAEHNYKRNDTGLESAWKK